MQQEGNVLHVAIAALQSMLATSSVAQPVKAQCEEKTGHQSTA
jgi:hypothetical protein